MNKCVFNRKGLSCEIMDVSNKEKDNYCHICKANCISEHDLIERYAEVIVRSSGQTKYNFTCELNKYAGRRVKLMQLLITSEGISSVLRENSYTIDTFAKAIDVPIKNLLNIFKGGPTSKLTAMFISNELGYPINELFANYKMS